MSNKDDAKKYFELGEEFYSQGNYNSAIENYQKALELDPTYFFAYNGWGLALANLNRYEEAIEKYQKALELDPTYFFAYYNWGSALANLKRYEEAIEKYQKALELDPTFVHAYNGWGLALANLKRYEEAIEKYQNALELDPTYVFAYINWGLALANLKRYEEAIEKYQKALELDPTFVHAYINWGLALADLKRYEEAIEKYQKALELDPCDIYAYYKITDLHLKQGKYGSAKKAAIEADQTIKQKDRCSLSGENLRLYGWMLHNALQELDRAEQEYVAGIHLDPNNPGLLISLGILLLDKEEKELEDKINNYWMARKNFKKAESLLKSQKKKTDRSYTLLQLGQIYIALEDYSNAEKALKRAQEIDSENPEICNNLGIISINKEEFKEAVRLFRDALDRDPDNLTIRNNLASAYLRAERLEDAEKEYRDVLKVAPYNVEAHLGLGEVYTAMGDAGNEDMYNQAIECFEKGIKVSCSEKGSKSLKTKELAAITYSKGYARAKLYEKSKGIASFGILQTALKDFDSSYHADKDNYRAKRAKNKLEKKLGIHIYPRLLEECGPLVVAGSSFILFLITQLSFFLGVPIKITDLNYYSVLTFGFLLFLVAGIYLPQVLKLKVAGIELEKSALEQITPLGPLGISPEPVASKGAFSFISSLGK